MLTPQRVLLQGEVLVGAQVIDPEQRVEDLANNASSDCGMDAPD
jgi:hypothetical protein